MPYCHVDAADESKGQSIAAGNPPHQMLDGGWKVEIPRTEKRAAERKNEDEGYEFHVRFRGEELVAPVAVVWSGMDGTREQRHTHGSQYADIKLPDMVQTKVALSHKIQRGRMIIFWIKKAGLTNDQ